MSSYLSGYDIYTAFGRYFGHASSRMQAVTMIQEHKDEILYDTDDENKRGTGRLDFCGYRMHMKFGENIQPQDIREYEREQMNYPG